jgi:hypothetical protein
VPGGGRRAEHLGDAEVGEEQALVLGADEQVLRLDVAVDDLAPVGVVQGGRRLPQVEADLCGLQPRLAAEAVVQSAPRCRA